MSYPLRLGKPITAWDGKFFDLSEYARSQRVNPTPIEDLEPFIQTWLYFGLLVEFACIDLSEFGGSQVVDEQGLKDIIDGIYEATLVRDGETTYVSLDTDCLNSLLHSTRPRIPKDLEIRKKYYDHLNLCLSYTSSMLASIPKEFNHAVKCSIAALAELLMWTVHVAFQMLGLKSKFGRFWSTGFFNEEIKNSMKSHGWCPSDITRAVAKYKSVQGLYVCQMMDKSLPSRDHRNCSETVCKYFQVVMEAYQMRHQDDSCCCSPLQVDSGALETILRKKNVFPVLRFKGDLHDLTVELVESTLDVPYVAISHVWADGLGNPKSNSLHRCKLHHLRKLVASLNSHDIREGTLGPDAPMIWLDTLCCPAQDGYGKQIAIEKIRDVYQQAKHVLVLDAGLMSYSASVQDEFEQLARIFTSSWMRRLWTLQEGALAKSLYFQFADKAVSLRDLMSAFQQKCNSMKYMAICADFFNEYRGLTSFFHPVSNLESYDQLGLATLDLSLNFRSVSVPFDEPLCVGSLMSLDLRKILDVTPKDKRMQKVWELIASKKSGLPMQVIFFQEPRIDTPGWRWAPRSLLTWGSGSHELVNTRMLRWHEPRLGEITDRGIRVQYPGYRIKIAKEIGGGPQIWPGFPRRPEFNIFFRDKDTGLWYCIYDKEYARLNNRWSDAEKVAYHKLGLFPLHDIAETDNSVLILNASIGKLHDLQEGVFGTVVAKQSSESPEEGIPVRTGQIIMLTLVRQQTEYMYDTLRRLAIDLRTDDLAQKHMAIYNSLVREYHDFPDQLKLSMEHSEDLKKSVEQLEDKMQRMVQDVAAKDAKFVEAVQATGEGTIENIWCWIYDFVAYDYVGEKLGDQQVWYVD